MADKAWKAGERRLAEILLPLFPKAHRNPLSGMTRATGTKADIKETGLLFVEYKKLKRVPGWRFFEKARKEALEEGKRIAVVVLQKNGSPNRMALVDLDEWIGSAVEQHCRGCRCDFEFPERY